MVVLTHLAGKGGANEDPRAPVMARTARGTV
jgi:hypothetical protein